MAQLSDQEIEARAVKLREMFLPDTYWRYTGESGTFRKQAIRVLRWVEGDHLYVDFQIMRDDLAEEPPHIYRMSVTTLVRNHVAHKFNPTVWRPEM